jgi:hypothetical protein
VIEIVQNFIYKHAAKNEHILKNIDFKCACCKAQSSAGIETKKIVSGNFTNWDLLTDKYLCEACANLLKGDFSTELRRTSFIVYKDELMKLKNDRLLKHLLNIKKTPFAVGITFSYKKHNAFRCELNYDTNNYFIRVEDELIEFNKVKVTGLLNKMKDLYLTYFTKEEIRKGKYNIHNINKFGIEKFQYIESELQEERGTALFNLLVDLLPSELRVSTNKKIKEKEKQKKEREKNAVKCNRKKIGNIALFDLD